MDIGRHQKILVSLSLMAVSISTARIFSKNVPDGVWVGMYSYYPLVWTLLTISIVLILYAALIESLPWGVFVFYGVSLITAIGSISLVWGVPFRSHDPWIHFGLIRFESLGPPLNPYPALHTLLITVAEMTGITPVHWLSTVGVLMAIVTMVFIIILARRLPGANSNKQVAILAILPAAFMRFSPRPFSLAWAFTPLIYWFIFMYCVENVTGQRNRHRDLLLGAAVLAPLFHPQLSGFLSVVVVTTVGIAWLCKSKWSAHHIRPEFEVNTVSFSLLSILTSVVFVSYLLLYTETGPEVLILTTDAVLSGAGPTGLKQASTGTGIFGFYNSFDAAVEASTRLAYILITGSIVAYESGTQLFNERIDSRFATGWVTSGVITGGFLLLLIATSTLGVERLISFVPLIAVPATLFGLINRKRAILVLLAILCITSGLATAYASDIKGQAGVSTNARQVAAVDWLSSHNGGQQIVGTYATDYLLRAEVPPPRVYKLQYRLPVGSTARYEWQVRESDGLYVTDGTTKALLEQYVAENEDSKILHEFEYLSITRNKVYTNSDSSVYTAA